MKRIKIFLSSIVEKSVHHVMTNKKLKLTPEEIPKIRFIVAFQHEDTKTYPHQHGVNIPPQKNVSYEK